MDGVKVLAATRIVGDVEKLIDDADEFLILVSPFARLWNEIEDAIIAAHEHGVEVHMVVGKRRNVSRELVREGVNVVVSPSVHAKIYATERAAILTSLNLTTAGGNHSLECGVLIERSGAPELYAEALAQARAAVDAAEADDGPEGPARRSSRRDGGGRDSGGREGGSRDSGGREPARDRGGDGDRDAFCISCGSGLRFDRERPQCRDCFDDDAPGGRCHACGESDRTDRRRPLCHACHRDR